MDSKAFPAAIWTTDLDELTSEKGLNADLVGMLEFDGGEIKLDIPIGCLLDWPQERINGGRVQYHTAGGLHVDAAYGYSQRGDWFVLRDVYSPGPSESIPGFQSQTLFASSLMSLRPRVPRSLRVSVPFRSP